MSRKTLRTKEELDGILAAGGLELAEKYDAEKSYPKKCWLLTRCITCGVEAHYRIKYIQDKVDIREPVCRACYWREWFKEPFAISTGAGGHTDAFVSEDAAKRFANEYGFDLVELLRGEQPDAVLFLVACQSCGRKQVLRACDVPFRCSCQSHPDTSAYYAPPVTREVK